MKSPRGMVDFKITCLGGKGKALEVESAAEILPSHPIPYSRKWKHLMNMSLADLDFGTSGSVNILLGADVFGRAVLHGRQFGPLRTHPHLKLASDGC